MRLVERHGIRYHEKKLGQLFCDGSAMEIVNLLERECAEAGASVLLFLHGAEGERRRRLCNRD